MKFSTDRSTKVFSIKVSKMSTSWFARVWFSFFLLQSSCTLNENRISGHLGHLPPPPIPSSLTLGKLEVTNISATVVRFSISYSGDSNNNGQVSVYFCSIKTQAGCDPLDSEVIILSKSSDFLEGTVDLSSTSITPGDFLKYKVVAEDAEGLSGGTDNGFVFIPLGGSQKMGILQINEFTLGRKQGDVSYAGSEYIYAATRDSANNLYLAGSTTSAINEPNAGELDLVIIKLSPDGTLNTQFGREGVLHLGLVSSSNGDKDDVVKALVHDNNGNLFVAGQTASDLGGPNAGSNDGFIAKLNATTGAFDTVFGDGDGHDDDGILQLNASQTNSATSDDYINALLLDGSGNLFVVGYTFGDLGGANAGGDYDGFVAKLNATTGMFDTSFGDGDGNDDDGILQFNNSQTNSAISEDQILALGLDGNESLFVAGYTAGALGGTNAGGYDGFIAKLNATTGVFDSTFGDGDGNDDDGILQLNASQTNSATSDDHINALLLDGSGNLFVAGQTDSSLGGAAAGGYDGFIAKLNATTGVFDSTFGDGDGHNDDGILQFNSSQTNSATGWEFVNALAFDGSGNIFLAGSTDSSLGGANSGGDGFVIKLNATTGVLDTTFGDGDGNDDDGILQLNTSLPNLTTSYDQILAIVLDESGNLLVTGDTDGSFGGNKAGGLDGFVVKLNATTGVLDTTFGDGDGHGGDGILQFNAAQTLSAASDDYIKALVLDGSGNMFVAGSTDGALGGPNAGNSDGFIAKLNATTGVFDTTFGDGDGYDDDGILQLNNSQTNSATSGDGITALVLDGSGFLYAAGGTESSLGGPNAGVYDGFIAKLNATTGVFDTTFGDGDGNDDDGILQLNASQANSATANDTILAMVLDGSGNLFVAGQTYSSLGGANAGFVDIFIAKVNATTGVFDTVFGDGDGHDDDGILQLNASQTNSATSEEYIRALLLDGSGNLFMAGYAFSALGGTNAGSSDGFIAKINTTTGLFDTTFGDGDGHNDDGILQFNNSQTNFATLDDYIYGLVVDGSGYLYAAGHTYSALGGTNSGVRDGFIAKLNATTGIFDTTFGDGDGNDDDGILQLNNSQTNSATSADFINAIALDGSGNLFVAGDTFGALGGASGGQRDGFIAKINATTGVFDTTFGDGDGNDDDGILQLNASQTNSASSYDEIHVIALDGNGNLYVAGETESSLASTNAGGSDGFIILSDQISGAIVQP